MRGSDPESGLSEWEGVIQEEGQSEWEGVIQEEGQSEWEAVTLSQVRVNGRE